MCETPCVAHAACPASGLRGQSFGGLGCGEYVTPCLGHAFFPVSGLCGKSFDGRGCGARETLCLGHTACLESARAALGLTAVAWPDPLADLLCFVVPSSVPGAF